VLADGAGGFLLTIVFKNNHILNNRSVVSYIVSQLVPDNVSGGTSNPEIIPDGDVPYIQVHYATERYANAALSRVCDLVAEE